jgi:antitoxin (DNA-binding transcriptional repressor) of toxin-antitoxin stability system
MIVTATELANNSKGIVDRVLNKGESAEIHRHGKAVCHIRRSVGINAAELSARLQQARFTAAESKELSAAMTAAGKMLS